MKPKLFAFDMESTLTEEFWPALAEKTGLADFRLTTKDVKDYSELMRFRITKLREERIPLSYMRDVMGTLNPLPGAREFLDWLRRRHPTVLISDTFYEYAMPLIEKLGNPLVLAHSLSVGADGIVTNFHLRNNGNKPEVVKAFKAVGFDVTVVGDSYNDTKMMAEADRAYFMHAPESIAKEFPQFPAFQSYKELQQQILAA